MFETGREPDNGKNLKKSICGILTCGLVQRDEVLLKARSGGGLHAQNLVYVGGMETKGGKRESVVF